MKNSALALKSKGKHPEKSKVVMPKVGSNDERPSSSITMDGTAHIEISSMQNIYYSKEIIEDARKAFNIERLRNFRSFKMTSHRLSPSVMRD
jgi:hypothetical protein